MITLEDLKANGTDTETGLARCLGKEDLYLKLVNMDLGDTKFEELGTALEAEDLQKSFELCHALKGVIGNLAITPLYEALSQKIILKVNSVFVIPGQPASTVVK